MPTYRLSFYFDFGSGLCLWGANARTNADFPFPPDPEDLPLSPVTRTLLDDLCAWYDGALNWASPSEPGPWRQVQCDEFNAAARAGLETVRAELGADWQVEDNFLPLSEDPDLDRYLADPAGFQRPARMEEVPVDRREEH